MKNFKIVADSCCEITDEMKARYNIEVIPFGLQVKDYHTQDDEDFDQLDFIKRVAECEECAKSACPSPERFMTAFEDEVDHIFVVTISARLSGCYNSANLGRDLYIEEHGEKKIHIVDSKSAASGQHQLVLRILELEEAGESYENIVEQIEAYRDELHTYFVLNNLDTLRKNGRLSGIKSVVASTLSIKPVMHATVEGEIAQLGQAIGINKALKKMVGMILEDTHNIEKKRVMISYCNCLERAEFVKALFLEKADIKDIQLIPTGGLSTMYANDGGIIIAV